MKPLPEALAVMAGKGGRIRHKKPVPCGPEMWNGKREKPFVRMPHKWGKGSKAVTVDVAAIIHAERTWMR